MQEKEHVKRELQKQIFHKMIVFGIIVPWNENLKKSIKQSTQYFV